MNQGRGQLMYRAGKLLLGLEMQPLAYGDNKMNYFKLLRSLSLIFFAVLFFSGDVFPGSELSRTTLKVPNLFCGSCLTHINSRFETIPEVKGMAGSARRGIVMVDHDFSLVAEEIAFVITELGYPAEVLTETAIDEEDSLEKVQGRNSASGCCGSGSGTYRGCGATSGSWKRLFGIPSGNGNDSLPGSNQ